MRMRSLMRAYVYVFMFVFVYVYVGVCLCMFVYVSMHVCMYVCMYACMHVCDLPRVRGAVLSTARRGGQSRDFSSLAIFDALLQHNKMQRLTGSHELC